jgi:hypothetical protein
VSHHDCDTPSPLDYFSPGITKNVKENNKTKMEENIVQEGHDKKKLKIKI